MPSKRAYQYSVMDMALVMSDPEEFIIPENLEACKLLWSKNIFTKMCNNYDNDYSWITINTFSPENQRLFESMCDVDKRFGLTWGGIGFKVPIKPEKGKSAFEAFRELIELFPMQDVQKDGYMDIETFMLYYTDCYSVQSSPEYLELIKPMMSPDGDVLIYSRGFEKKISTLGIRRTTRVFDPSKMIKSYEEYVEESQFKGLYDSEEGKVYYNKMYYDAHIRYKESIKTPKLV